MESHIEWIFNEYYVIYGGLNGHISSIGIAEFEGKWWKFGIFEEILDIIKDDAL